MSVTYKAIDSYDVTNLIGLRAIVVNAAQEVEENGEISIEVPDIESLAKAAAMARCLMPLSLTSKELKNIRKIIGWSASELAEKWAIKLIFLQLADGRIIDRTWEVMLKKYSD